MKPSGTGLGAGKISTFKTSLASTSYRDFTAIPIQLLELTWQRLGESTPKSSKTRGLTWFIHILWLNVNFPFSDPINHHLSMDFLNIYTILRHVVFHPHRPQFRTFQPVAGQKNLGGASACFWNSVFLPHKQHPLGGWSIKRHKT